MEKKQNYVTWMLHCPRKSRIDTLNYELDRLLPKGKNKKVVGLMKDEFGGKIMKEFAALRAKRCSYLTYYNDEDKKTKGTKSVLEKENLNLKITNTA